MREPAAIPGRPPLDYWDIWTWTVMCADTKLVPSWIAGRRDAGSAHALMRDLAGRLAHRVQLTTDGNRVYINAVEDAFGIREFREVESILTPGKPPTASSLGTGGVVLRRADVTVEVRTSLRVDTTPVVRLQLDVQRDGKDLFHWTREETIERRLL